MDSQRPILYIGLIFLAFLMWMTWQQDHAPQPVTTTTEMVANSAGQSVPSATTVPGGANVVPQAAPTTNAKLIRVRTDVLDLQISTQGGDVIITDLPTYPISLDEPDVPVRILDLSKRNYIAQSGLLHQAVTGQDTALLAPSHLAEFTAEQTDYVLPAGQNELVVPLHWQSPTGVSVTKFYRFKRGQFAIDVEQQVQNNSTVAWAGLDYQHLQHGPVTSKRNFLTSGVQAFQGGAYYQDGKYQRLAFDKMRTTFPDQPASQDAVAQNIGGWVSMLEHYFISAWVPPQENTIQYYSKEITDKGAPAYILGMKGPLKQVNPGSTDTFTSKLWVGPKLQDELAEVAKGLDLTVDYGIFAFVSKPIFWLMQWIHSWVHNWGWTIVLLTLFIKLLFFWPSAASYKSMAKMKAVAPKLKELNERYSSDPQAKQKALMDIYKKEKINPLGGCLPILIQIPVFMGLYWVLLESVELRQAPWILWYKDLSIPDPYFVLPILMGASMFLQQKLNPPPSDPMQQKIFQFLPLIFTVMFLWFPSGLVLYWVVNNILSIAQQWVINKKIIGHA